MLKTVKSKKFEKTVIKAQLCVGSSYSFKIWKQNTILTITIYFVDFISLYITDQFCLLDHSI